MKTPGIYLIRNKTTNKVYVGQSIDIPRRWKQHICYLNNNSHKNSILQNAWNKYGEDDFEFSILKICEASYKELNKWESHYIEQYQALDRDKGYNIAAGGDNAGNTIAGFSKDRYREFCENSSRRLKEYYKTHESPFKGKHFSEASKQKLSEGRKGSKHWNYGKKRPEHSQAMSRGNNSRAKQVICIETGEIFQCAKDAAEKYGITNSALLKTCKGVQKTSAGLHWRYAD